MTLAIRLSEALRAWRPAHARPLPAAEERRILGPARMERHGGLSAVYLSGTPYDMGYQHGVLARDLIHGFREAAYDYVTAQLPVPRRLARPLLFSHAATYWPTLPPELLQEMRGIADGAGVHPIEVLVSTAIWEMFLVSGCSEFAAVSPYTPDGSLLHGYNYDLMHPDHALIQPYLAVLFFRPDHGLPFFTVNTVGSVGANAGMNGAGISVAWDNTNLKDDTLTRGIGLPVVPFIITLRRLLQYAETIDQAVHIVVESLPRPLGDCIVVGSAGEGRAVALETAGSQFAVRPMAGGAVWSTNCFRSPELAPHDRRGDPSGLSAKESWRCFPRFSAYTELFAAHRDRLTPAAAASFLRDPYPREAEGYLHPNPAARATICRNITSWSLVMEPGKGRFWASDVEVPGSQGRFFAFRLAGGGSGPASDDGDPGPAGALPELDLPPSGYQAALRAAEYFGSGAGVAPWTAACPGRQAREGRQAAAHAALEEALELDGPSAPLLLFRAALLGRSGEEVPAAETARRVVAAWPGTPAGRLAAAWLAGPSGGDAPDIPFPSAIRPLLRLRPGSTWAERITPDLSSLKAEDLSSPEAEGAGQAPPGTG